MADRFDFYFRQSVGESELDGAFESLEVADRLQFSDLGLSGVVSGLVVSASSGLVLSASAGTAYDASGQRVHSGPAVAVDGSVDAAGVPTAVSTTGREKWLSIYVGFARVLSDSRLDGNGTPVYFSRAEGVEFRVVQGLESTTGNATRPVLDPTRVLLADVLRTHAQSSFVDGDLDITRRQDAWVFAGAGLSVRRGVLDDVISDIIERLNLLPTIAQSGQTTLVGGTVTITGVTLTSASRILATRCTAAGTPGDISVPAADRNVSASSFKILSTSILDTSTLDWWVVE